MDDLKQAMRDRNTVALDVIRFLKAEIKNAEIAAGKALDDAGVAKVVAKQLAQTQEALDQFLAAGRSDLVDLEKAKQAVLQQYAPEQLSEAELESLIKEVMSTTSEPSLKTVMPAVLKKVGTRAPGKLVAQLVQKALS